MNNTNENNRAYVLIADVRHADPCEQQDDGTIVLGVYTDLDLAKKRLIAEYDEDKENLLDGSCRPDGICEITEDTPCETQYIDGIPYGAFAQIVVSIKDDGSFDREYTYSISAHTINN